MAVKGNMTGGYMVLEGRGEARRKSGGLGGGGRQKKVLTRPSCILLLEVRLRRIEDGIAVAVGAIHPSPLL
jgi:hypothetical protein